MSKLIDLTGQRFGRLTVLYHIKKPEHIKNPSAWFHCICDCGNYKDTTSYHLRHGLVTSCGCYCIERATKHGMWKSRIYRIWAQMKDRCNNKNRSCYPYYGGRGITFCNEWESFEEFYKWAINNGYKDGLTLDRIDVNGNYCPSNCRWSTMKEQGRNRRNNIFYTIDGETLCLSEWCERYGMSHTTVKNRIKHGWDVKKAVTTPPLWPGPKRKQERDAS